MAVAAGVKMEERAYAGSGAAELPKVRELDTAGNGQERCGVGHMC